MIFNFRNPYRFELLFSYLYERHYTAIQQSSESVIEPTNKNIPCRFMSIHKIAKETGLDELFLLNENSVIPFSVPSRTEQEQDYIIEDAVYNSLNEPQYKQAHGLYGRYRICPVCYENDKKEGKTPYLRTYHQIGNTSCPYHHVPLLEFSTCVMKYLPFITKDKKYEDKFLRHCRELTVQNPLFNSFLFRLWKHSFNVCRRDLNDVIRNRLKILNIPLADEAAVVELIRKKNMMDYFKPQIGDFHANQIQPVKSALTCFVEIRWIYALMFVLYDGDFKELSNDLLFKNNGSYIKFYEKIGDKYQVLSNYGVAIEVACTSCNCEKIVSPYRLINNLFCEFCNANLDLEEEGDNYNHKRN